jgi:hypothetical protein
MKAKKHLLSLIIISFFTFSAQSQSYLKVNPLALSVGVVGSDIEIALSKKTSIQVFGFKSFMDPDLFAESDFPVIDGWGIGGAFRFYVTKYTGLKGLFLSPNLRARFGKKGTNNTFGLLLGYQWLFSNNRFSVEVGLGRTFNLNEGCRSCNSNPNFQTSFSIGYRLF